MTLACVEATSWDHMSAADVPALPGWSGSVGSVAAGLSGVGQAIVAPSTLDFRWTGSYETLLVCLRFRPSSTSVEREILGIYAANNLHIRLKHNTHGVLQVETGASGGGTWTAAEAVVLPGGVYLLEFIVRLHDTAGAFTVRLQGKTIAALNVSGTDTKGHTTAADRVRLNNPAGTYDDLMVRAGNGAYVGSDLISDRFGNPHFATWFPVGRGTHQDWAPVSGSGEHWEYIDDSQMDGNATELTTGTQGARESWVLPSLPAGVARVRDLSTVYAVRQQVSGQRIRHFLRLGGVDYDHPDATSPLQTFHDFEWRHWANSPATGTGWTIDEVQQVQAGIMRDTGSSSDWTRISQGVVVVTYESGATVELEDPRPVDVFDLVGTSGSSRRLELRERGSGGSHSAMIGYRVDERTADTWVVAISPAREVEIFRARELWRISRFGALPLLYPESVHHRPELGDVLVTIDQPSITQQYENPRFGSVSVTLRRWRP